MKCGGEIFDMAETLIVLAGENAWAAARAFGSDYARVGEPSKARHWRDVAGAVLRMRYAAATGKPLVRDEAEPVVRVVPVPGIAAVPPIEGEICTGAPVPLRARRFLGKVVQPQTAFAEAA